ncbi:hypothetical protein Q9233_013371 [Columba guinea]|nr:hypothetical protein Q9233_013371 [Columba guinea]
MADMKTGIFAKNVQKRLNRAQEKVRCGTGGMEFDKSVHIMCSVTDDMSSEAAENIQISIENKEYFKVLQKLGKADETKDEQFEEYVQNFKRQEATDWCRHKGAMVAEMMKLY